MLGALTLIATHGRAGYGPDDLAFAEQVAARAAMAVDNARLYREAREQQRRAAADREELRAQRDLYEALMRAQSELGEAFAVLDGERIVFVNRATERLTGRTADELYALESVFVLVAPEHRRAIGGRLRDARLGVEPREPGFVTEIVRPDGTRVRSRPPGARCPPRATTGSWSSPATSPSATTRRPSANGCCAPSRPRAAPARPPTRASASSPTRARCSSAR